MKEIILVRYGEIILKGLNRPVFEDKLIQNIKKAIKEFGRIKIIKSQARIFIEPEEENYDISKVMEKLTRVFGIISVSRVFKIDSNMQAIKEKSLEMVKALIKACELSTFKVETKRGDKRFPLQSPQISSEIGEFILENIPNLKVDVNNPDFTIYIEVREFTYIYSQKIPANCGMPTGTNGKALLMLSGGIDSPVAGWMMAKRGMELDAVHFYSYPYTSERAKEKVIELAKIVSSYCFNIKLYIVPFTDIQLKINEKCPKEDMTVIMRRVMMAIAEKIAKKTGSQAIVTGESLGQVASQTISSIAVTNQVATMPVFRPLIGMDKNEVVAIARKIGTFETSILPYEDCCTVFTAKHPNTKPKLYKIVEAQEKAGLEELIEKAVNDVEIINV